MHFEAGTILCREGDFSNDLYIVKTGILEGNSLQNNQKKVYGPGSIIGEFNLVENIESIETIRVLVDSDVQVINESTFKDVLANEPGWVGSIVAFLSKRAQIAERDYEKKIKIKSLPGLLYLLSSYAPDSVGVIINLSAINRRMENLCNLNKRLVKELLQILEELDILKIQETTVKIKNRKIVELLYQSILHRAVKKASSPDILSITEQMVLTAVIKAVQESTEPLHNGTCVIPTGKLIETTKKTTHGMTLTMRNVLPLLDKNILRCNAIEPLSPTASMDSIHCFYGDFDHILDLMELNRIYPLLDKKLI